MNNEQQSKNIKRDYLASERLMLEKPQIVGFLDSLEQQVIDFAKEQGMEEIKLRRLVMGKVGFQELIQKDTGSFFKLKKVRPTTDWNGLVSLASKEDDDFHFDKMSSVKRKYASLKEDTLQDGDEIRAKIETIKAQKDEEKQKLKKKKVLPRVKLYKEDVDELMKIAHSIGRNYNQHLVIIGCNKTLNKQILFPRFTYGNTGK